MDKFYTIEGNSGKHFRHTLEEATKRAKLKASKELGEEIVILQAYAVACTPISNVDVTVL